MSVLKLQAMQPRTSPMRALALSLTSSGGDCCNKGTKPTGK